MLGEIIKEDFSEGSIYLIFVDQRSWYYTSVLPKFISRFNANPNKIPTDLKNEIGSAVASEMQKSFYLMKNERGLALPEYHNRVDWAQG